MRPFIGPEITSSVPEAEKIFFQMLFESTRGFFYNSNQMVFYMKTDFRINFGLLEVLEIDDGDSDDDDDDDDDDDK